ncbi:MAG: PAS domain S-box protein [candidate division NC10 bacterium]|nr:PAS domain S-box protein [candidate division NC10 bacterium]
MKQPDTPPTHLPSPWHVFLKVLGIIFLAEVATMLLVEMLPLYRSTLAAGSADAAMLVILSAPFLWWVVVRPLRRAAMEERLWSGGGSRILGKTVEMHGFRRDGSEFPLELSLAAWQTGQDRFFSATIRDISERKRAEEQLRLQSVALESAANAVVITDREGRITWVNPAFTRLTGYTPEETLGQNPRLIKSGNHGQVFYRELWETILSGRVWQREMTNRCKDGSIFTEEQTITPVRDQRGEITHFVSIDHDISARRRAEEKLRASEERYRLLFETNPHPMWVYDLESLAFLAVNDAAIRHYGYSRDEFLALTIRD